MFLNYSLLSIENDTDGPFAVPATGSLTLERGPAVDDIPYRLNMAVNNQIVRNLIMSFNVNAAGAGAYTVLTGGDDNGDGIFNDRPSGVGRNTAERFKWKIGDKVPIMSPIWGRRTWEFDIVGIYDGAKKGTDTTAMFFRYDYFDESRQENRGKGLVGWYTIRVKDPARAAEVAALVDAEFENSPAETKAESAPAKTESKPAAGG